jgi:hypothetical protein
LGGSSLRRLKSLINLLAAFVDYNNKLRECQQKKMSPFLQKWVLEFLG